MNLSSPLMVFSNQYWISWLLFYFLWFQVRRERKVFILRKSIIFNDPWQGKGVTKKFHKKLMKKGDACTKRGSKKLHKYDRHNFDNALSIFSCAQLESIIDGDLISRNGQVFVNFSIHIFVQSIRHRLELLDSCDAAVRKQSPSEQQKTFYVPLDLILSIHLLLFLKSFTNKIFFFFILKSPTTDNKVFTMKTQKQLRLP